MTPPLSLLLGVLGAGTVGYHFVKALAEAPFVTQLRDLLICDMAKIRAPNLITCPLYAGHLVEWKSERLAHLARTGFGEHRVLPARSLVCWIEKLDWHALLDPSVSGGAHIVLLVGLDNWNSRLSVTQDLRALVASQPALAERITQIQIGIDRLQASVSVFGSGFAEVCPACGKSMPLPMPEPCTSFNTQLNPVRGNLHGEASSAAQFACRIIDAILAGQRAAWINTKTNLLGHATDRCLYPVLTRVCQTMPGCLGPHTPAVPIRWDQVSLQSLDRSR